MSGRLLEVCGGAVPKGGKGLAPSGVGPQTRTVERCHQPSDSYGSPPVAKDEATPEHVGDIAFVLHSHMPYVEGFGTYPFGEEWLFDAVVRSYLPLLEFARDVTFTVTPVLADQLEAPGVPERLLTFAREFRLGSARIEAEAVEEAALIPACLGEAERYERAVDQLEELGDDLLRMFRDSAADGRVDLMASSATHAVLPLLATRDMLDLQIDAGLRSHRRRFGPGPLGERGFWLPECAYVPGLELVLADHGVDYFCVDQSRHGSGGQVPSPIPTEAGPRAFPIDWDAISWLWSFSGYPSDPAYAEFHSKTMRGVRAWRIGKGGYDPAEAAEAAQRQAGEFVEAMAARLRDLRDSRDGEPGLCVFAIDTELLGHWWGEGPQWFKAVLEQLPSAGVRALKMGEAMAKHPGEARPIGASTWGEDKDFHTWDSPNVADLTWGARRLEIRLLRDIANHELNRDAAMRATRELLAVQASDWAFLDHRKQAGDYPFQRTIAHAEAMHEALESPDQVEPRLRALAPDLNLAPLLEP